MMRPSVALSVGRTKSYCRVLVVLSGQLLAVTNRTAESWWLFLAHVWPQQIVLPSLGGSFWPPLGCNKSYCRVLVALSGQLLAVTNRTAAASANSNAAFAPCSPPQGWPIPCLPSLRGSPHRRADALSVLWRGHHQALVAKATQKGQDRSLVCR